MTKFTECSEMTENLETAQIYVCAVSNYGFWDFVFSLAGPIVLSLGLIVALLNIRSARETARKVSTLNMIEKVESVPHYRELHDAFSYHTRMKSFSRLHAPNEEKDKAERTNVLDYLNHYELVSIGIESGVLDREIYEKWMKGPFIRDWNAAAEFIQRERWKYDPKQQKWAYRNQLFEHYQKVAVNWSKEAKDLTEKTTPPPKSPEGPGDTPLPDSSENGRS